MHRRPWERVPGFYMWAHYERIRAMVMRAVEEKIAREVPVDRKAAVGFGRKASNGGERIKWFLHIPSGEVWELVRPEDEVRSGTSGFFRRVEIKARFQGRYKT